MLPTDQERRAFKISRAKKQCLKQWPGAKILSVMIDWDRRLSQGQVLIEFEFEKRTPYSWALLLHRAFFGGID